MLADVRQAFRDGTYLIRQHFLDRLLEREIELSDVADAIREDAPEVIEDYPNDPRGPSALILCQGPTGGWYHVQCSYPPTVWLVTVYRPDLALWTEDLRRRRKQ